MFSQFRTMTNRLALLICVSVCLAHTAFGLRTLSPMGRLQQQSVSLYQEEISIVPLNASRPEYLTVTLTKCEGNGVSFAVLPSLHALSNATKWTRVDDIVTTIHAGHGSNQKEMVYLALRHSAPVEKNARSFIILELKGVPQVASPTKFFSVPNSKAQIQWNAKTQKVNAIFPPLIKENNLYSKLHLSRSHSLSYSYRMFATGSEKLTTAMTKCGVRVKGNTPGVIELTQPVETKQGALSFEFQPTEPVYYISLVASVAVTHFLDISKVSWRTTLVYPATKYQVPAAYIKRKN